MSEEQKTKEDNLLRHKVLLAIYEWKKSHEGRVAYYGSFISFNEEGEVTEAVWTCCGVSSIIRDDIAELLKKIHKDEKDDFVIW